MNNIKINRNQIFEDRSIYDDAYYDSINKVAIYKNLQQEYGTPSTALRGAITLLIKAGYILIQTACIPTWNVYNLIYFNLVDFIGATLGFLCLGFFLSFGNLSITIFSKEADYDEAVVGWCASVLVSTLVTVLLAGRLSKSGFFIVITIVNWLIAPLFLYFIWSDKGLMYKQSFMNETVGLKDYGGCLLIHVVGSLIGFIGILFLGRRVMRLKEIYECSLGPDAPGLAVVGYFFIMIGLPLLNLPTRIYEKNSTENNIGLIIINNILAAVGSMAMVIIFGIYFQTYISYWFLLRIIQAGVAGMVMISAGSDVFTPIASLGTGIFAGIIFYWAAQFTYFSAFEDYCNVLAIHLIPGIIGIVAPTVYASKNNLGFGTVKGSTALAHLMWQSICLLLSLVIVISVFSLLFYLLRKFKRLRSTMEEVQHTRAERILKRSTPRRFCWRIFPPKDTSIVLLPGYESKHIFMSKRNFNVLEMNDQFMPKNNDKIAMFAKIESQNPFEKERHKKTHDKKLVTFFNNSNLITKNTDTKPRKIRNRFITTKSCSEPFLDIPSYSTTMTQRRHSTSGISESVLYKQHKYIQRPWNIHKKIRLYGLKKTEKRCNITLEHFEKYNRTMEPIIHDYSEIINLNDETVKVIKSPIRIDDCYESISESEM